MGAVLEDQEDDRRQERARQDDDPAEQGHPNPSGDRDDPAQVNRPEREQRISER